MKQLTFMGTTPSEALKKATEVCGEEATVVSTKKIKEATASSPSIYEVVVVQEGEGSARRVSPRQSSLPKGRDSQDIVKSDELIEIRKQNSFLIKEIEKLNRNMNTIQMTLYNQIMNGRGDRFIVPPEFMSIYNQLIASRIEEELVKKIIQTMMKTTSLENKSSGEKVERILNDLLKKMLKVKEPAASDSGMKKLMMFFGPTGVGKTTTIAKIGMGLKEADKNKKIGLVNLDTFRVGADKQVAEYGSKFGFNVANAAAAKELINIITRKMKKESVIMIDTAGSSQYDNEKIAAINEFLEYNKKMRIEKSLLIPANIKYDDMMEIYERFRHLKIDNVIFTKLDETSTYGNIFTFLYNTKLKVSHFTVGQQVPSDIKDADKKWFLDRLFGEGQIFAKKRD